MNIKKLSYGLLCGIFATVLLLGGATIARARDVQHGDKEEPQINFLLIAQNFQSTL